MILVVGGAGYLGSCVVDELVHRKMDIVVYDNLLYLDEYRRDVPFVFRDVTDHDELKHYLNYAFEDGKVHKVDAVIWLAALVGDGVCMLDPVRAKEVNQESVKWLAQNYEGKIVFTSTCSVYGHLREAAHEDSPLNPLSIYAETKAIAEHYLGNYAKQCIIFRLGTLHGVSDRMRFDLVVNAMVRDAYFNHEITVFGGAQKRPLLSVMDAAVAIVDAALHPQFPVGVYNLAKENRTVMEIAVAIADEMTKTEINCVKMESEDRRDYSVNCDKANRILGFQPKDDVTMTSWDLGSLLSERRLKDPFSSRYSNQEAYRCQNRD